MGHYETKLELERRIRKELNPTELDIEDQSHLHAGHAGAKGGGGHFFVRIVSEKFQGLSLLQRQRLVFAAVGNLMEQKIHALSMKCLPPDSV